MHGFSGAKGGGSGSSFKQRPDTLRSTDTFEGLLGLCAGPIKGLTRGLKSLKIDGTPLEDESGKLNFENFVAVLADGDPTAFPQQVDLRRSEEHTSELQSLMRISYAVFCLKKKKKTIK